MKIHRAIRVDFDGTVNEVDPTFDGQYLWSGKKTLQRCSECGQVRDCTPLRKYAKVLAWRVDEGTVVFVEVPA